MYEPFDLIKLINSTVIDAKDIKLHMRNALCLQVLTVVSSEMVRFGSNVNGLK